MKKTLILAVALIAALLTGCSQSPSSSQWNSGSQDVQVYKVAGTNGTTVVVNNNGGGSGNNSTMNDWLFWYVFWSNGHCYYSYSPTYIAPSSYSSMRWASSTTAPEEVQEYQSGKLQGSEVGTEQVPDNDLGKQVESEMAENGYAPASDAEQAEAAAVSSGSSSSVESGSGQGSGESSGSDTSSGDSGSGDSGGGDSGGGDSGGGDGGGGGD